MKKPFLLALAAVALIGAGCVPSDTQPVSSKKAMFCGPDGVLTDTMPIQSHRSYCIRSDAGSQAYAPGIATPYSFSIIDDRGNALKDFAITHTRPMHLIVVRNDLQHFQHPHPDFDPATGVFMLNDLTFPADGVYRIFADFLPDAGSGILSLPVTVSEVVAVGSGKSYVPEPIGNPDRTKTFGDLRVKLSVAPEPLIAGEDATLTFDLSNDGRAVTDLQEYLGAMGHSVIVREDTLDFIHAHPAGSTEDQDGKVRFMVHFPTAGNYKVFTQFQRDGAVVTTDFVTSVKEGSVSSDPMLDHAGMGH